MKKKPYWGLDAANIIISFLVCRWLFMHFLYGSMLTILGLPSSAIESYRPLFFILVLSFLLFTLLRGIYAKYWSRLAIYILYILYFIILFYLVFFKTPGLQGMNWNIIQAIQEAIYIDRWTPIWNILMFVPFGFLMRFRLVNVIKLLFVIISIESVQYLYSLGIFDISDIVTNLAGGVLGMLLHDSHFGKKIVRFIK